MNEHTQTNVLLIVTFAVKRFEGKIILETTDIFIPKTNLSNVQIAARDSVNPAHWLYTAHMPGHHHHHVWHVAVRPGHAVLLRASGSM